MKTVPLKRIVGINLATLPETTEPSFEFRYVDIGAVGRGKLLSEPEATVFAAAPSRARRLVRQGDTIISTVRTYLRAVWPVLDCATDLVVSTGFAVLTPTGSIDPRYLGWLVQSDVVVEEVVARSVGVSYPAINPSDIGTVRVPLPSLANQRAIADYLDRETARIDALIEKKGKLVSLLQSRVETVVENHVRQLVEEYGSTPLKYAVRRVEVGIVITPSVWYGDEGGVPALRGLNVQPGRIDVTDLVYLTEEGHEVHRKSVLRQGDVVVVRTGQAGAAAVVPSELDGCNCIDLVIVRPSPDLVPQFLEYVLNSDWTQKHVEEYSVGTIQSHFNVGAMKQVPIPLPPLGRQAEEVEKLGTERAAIEELKECLTRQIDLLTEHRQALITAAVTGELEIPGVAA